MKNILFLSVLLALGTSATAASQDMAVAAKSTSTDFNIPITYNIQTTRTYDKTGTNLNTDFDFKISNNFSSNLSGQAFVRFTHDWDPRDAINSIDLRLVNIVYLMGLLNISMGRIDLSSILNPSQQYFGSYLTLGQRRADGVYLFLPFTLYGNIGVDQADFKLPPAALSIGYFPNFFSLYPESKQYDNGFGFAELKLPIMLFNNALITTLNYATTTNYTYLQYSPLSGKPALSLNLDYTISQNYKFYSEFAICNVADLADTTAFMAGTSAKNLNAFTFGIVDEICMEYQIPLITSTVNPLVGGNSFFPDQAQQQQGCWFASLIKHYDGLIFTIAATNSVGDFTMMRADPSAFNPNSISVLNDPRAANEVKSIGKNLLSDSYAHISYLVTVGTSF